MQFLLMRSLGRRGLALPFPPIGCCMPFLSSCKVPLQGHLLGREIGEALALLRDLSALDQGGPLSRVSRPKVRLDRAGRSSLRCARSVGGSLLHLFGLLASRFGEALLRLGAPLAKV